MTLQDQAKKTIEKHQMIVPGDGLLVTVSGGPDSVALLHLLCSFREDLRLRLEVAHLQHGIRGVEAQEDAKFVAELVAKLGLPLHLKEIDLPRIRSAAGRGNLEALARGERYRFFAAVARERKLGKIATAHTQDDQAETVLMWLLRGSGLKGLVGMPPVHPVDGTYIGQTSLTVVRPLLHVSRAEIEAYLNQNDLTFRVDRSNQDLSFLRNWIRLKLIPQLKEKIDGNLLARLAQQAELIRHEDDLMDGLARGALDEMRTAEGVNRGSLLNHSKAMQRRLLRLWIEATRGHLQGLDFQHVESLLDLIANGPPQGRLSIPGGWQLVKEYETLKLDKQSRKMGQQFPCYSYKLRFGEDLLIHEAGLTIQSLEISPSLAGLPDNFMEAVFDIASLTADLTLRNFRRGDRFQPLGITGHKKVKELFIEKKVPLAVRASLPVIVLGDEVIWIPGYGRSEYGRI